MKRIMKRMIAVVMFVCLTAVAAAGESVTGTGDQVILINKKTNAPIILRIESKGNKGWFSVNGLSRDGDHIRQLVSVYAEDYSGRVLSSKEIEMITVKTSSSWTIQTMPVESAERIEAPAEFEATGKDKCKGCCSSHGGVVCTDSVTICADGHPLSRLCAEKGCNACW